MKRLLRNSKLMLTGLALAAGILGLAANAAPAAHAAAPLPSITTELGATHYSNGGYSLSAIVQGKNFTPGGSVKVEVLDHSFNLVATGFTTGTQLSGCHWGPRGPVCTGSLGLIDTSVYIGYEPPVQTYYIIAYDFSSHQWSNWSSNTA